MTTLMLYQYARRRIGMWIRNMGYRNRSGSPEAACPGSEASHWYTELSFEVWPWDTLHSDRSAKSHSWFDRFRRRLMVGLALRTKVCVAIPSSILDVSVLHSPSASVTFTCAQGYADVTPQTQVWVSYGSAVRSIGQAYLPLKRCRITTIPSEKLVNEGGPTSRSALRSMSSSCGCQMEFGSQRWSTTPVLCVKMLLNAKPQSRQLATTSKSTQNDVVRVSMP
mmetsp:Transcript_50297/g.89828  ORF Transcript_50297/g.89828 Transcript_50297/m.89828 type:complete len:223 (-) Transcript_50297:283-951(-)